MRTEGTLKKAATAVRAALAIAAAGLGFGGCDWIHDNFMNSIPFRGKAAESGRDFHVYLGVDGLSYHTVKTAMENGAFAGPQWKLSKFITMFPGTSDASWTRIMRTPKLGGYEIEYYDPASDAVINRGIEGLAKHLMPSFAEFASFEFDYLKAFDFRANGYTSMAHAYGDTYVSLANTLDNFFSLLDGRVQTGDVFSAYFLEYDVMGHMRSSADVARALNMLSDKIENFQRHHRERRVHFTMLADHGMDFIRVKNERFVQFDEELKKVGINPVDSLGNHDPRQELFAIPIMHTRVTYLALHTHADLVEEISGRISRLASVDIALHKLRTPPKTPVGVSNPLEWYALWMDGKMGIYFGFDPETDRYYLPSGQEYARLGVELEFAADEEFKVMTDDQLFALTKLKSYPDVFYRTRTAFTPVSLKYPADVLVSFKPTWASMGFQLPGAEDIASAGFHGAMEELGSSAALLTTERDLPDAVRADTFLELFPRMKEHMHRLGVETIDGDRNASLQY